MALRGNRKVDGAACLQECIKFSYCLNTYHKFMEVPKFPVPYTLYLEQDSTHTHKPDFVFPLNGRVHVTWWA